eukprot:3671234-Alexandrium_andersonii.AAC.1
MPAARRPRRAARCFAAADAGIAGRWTWKWCIVGSLGNGVASTAGAEGGSRGPLQRRGRLPR